MKNLINEKLFNSNGTKIKEIDCTKLIDHQQFKKYLFEKYNLIEQELIEILKEHYPEKFI